MLLYSTNDCLNFWVFNHAIWYTDIQKSETNKAVVIRPLFLVSAHWLCWVHFSNSCKSLARCFNEQVVHLTHSLSLSLLPALLASYQRQLTNPNEQTLSHCTCVSDLQSRQLITIASIETLPPSAERASEQEERGEVRAPDVGLGAQFTVRRPAWPIKNN